MPDLPYVTLAPTCNPMPLFCGGVATVTSSSIKWIPAILLTMLMSAKAFADIATTNTKARSALIAGQAAEAQAALEEQYLNGDYDNQTLFLLALSSKQQGRFEESEKYLNELLLREPTASRVKLELAEVAFRNGRPDKAKRLLLEVKASSPPARVGENIESFLAFIEAGVPKAWSAYASAGLLYDTNANQGPDTDNVLIYDLPFTLEREAQGNHDWANLYKLGAGYAHELDDGLALQAGAHLSYTDYHRLDGFDAMNLSLSAGPSWTRDVWSFSLPYVFNTIRFGHSQDWYSLGQGFAPQVGWQITPRLLLQGRLAWQDRRYKDNSGRNGETLMLGSALRFALDASSHISVDGYIGQEDADQAISSNYSRGVELSYFKAFDRRFNLQLSSSYSHTDYDGIEPAWNKYREDRRSDLAANLNWLLAPQWNTWLTLSFNVTDNRSNIEMYSYKRQQTMFAVTRYF